MAVQTVAMDLQTVAIDRETAIKARHYARSKGLKIQYFFTEAVKHWLAYSLDMDKQLEKLKK